MLFIFITLVLDVLGIGLIIPVAPRLVEQLLGGGEADAAPYVGYLGATYAAMQFLFAPALGVLSDRVGRRPVILVSLLGSGLDYFALALSPTLAWLFVTRAINGLTGANITAASAYIADVTPPEKRAAGFGMIGAAFGLGFILGPLLGGYLGQTLGIRAPFYAAGALTLINWLYGVFVLPESLPQDRRAPFRVARANPVGALGTLMKYPMVLGLAVSMFLLNIAQFGLHATWVLYTAHRYGWGPEAVGASLAAVGICAAVVQGGLARKLVPMMGERRSVLFGLLLAIGAYLGYGFATHGWMIYVVIAVTSIGAISQPATQALITQTVHGDEQGTVQGAITSLQSLAGIIGPVIGGTVFAFFISKKAPVYLPGASFLVGAVLSAASLVVAYLSMRRVPRAGMPHPG